MRRSRKFPSYAPESLERKLHPSGVSGIPVAAEIRIQTGVATDIGEPAPTPPGTPEPTGPTDPTDGPDPAPPSGDGTPPIGTPSTPGGPSDPASR